LLPASPKCCQVELGFLVSLSDASCRRSRPPVAHGNSARHGQLASAEASTRGGNNSKPCLVTPRDCSAQMSRGPWAPIHVASVNNDLEALSRELENGVSPNLKELDHSAQRSPLVLVLAHARDPDVTASCISALLNAGASVDDSISVSQMGRMGPLHYAALRSFTKVVVALLEAGVEVDAINEGRTALHYAAGLTSKYNGLVEDCISSALAKRHEATTRVLLRAGATVNAATEGSHLTPLHFAAASGMYQVCSLLLAAGASVDLVGRYRNFGDTPLAYAYRWTPWHGTSTSLKRRVRRIVPLLLRAGAALPVMPVRLPREEYQAADHPSLTPFECPYIRKVRAAGGFKAYEKQHLAALVALLAPKFAHLVPTDVVPRIVSFWYPVGFW
jgi:ankyrin repeat protein